MCGIQIAPEVVAARLVETVSASGASWIRIAVPPMRTNPSPIRWLRGALLAGCMLAVAGSAHAASVYVDVMTSTGFGNHHSRASFESDMDISGWNPFMDRDLLLDYVGGGLGRSWVRADSPTVFEHVFTPDASVDSVTVTVTD